MATSRKKTNAIEDDIRIVGHGFETWAVVLMQGELRSSEEYPCVIHDNLDSREAAETARHSVLIHLATDPANPYGDFEVTSDQTNRAGRVLQTLRNRRADIKQDEVGLAIQLLNASQQDSRPSIGDVNDEIPF